MRKLLLVTMLSASCMAGEWPVLKTYEGENLRRVKMPMGGIGTGTISLAGRGAFVDWEIRNHPEKGYTPATSDASTGFWIRTEDARGRVSMRLLEGPVDAELYEGWEGPRFANHGFPRFRKCAFKAAYPLAQVELSDAAMPVDVTLEAMNPLVPNDSDESGIPAILLRWKIVNKTAEPLKVSVLGFLVNAAGGGLAKAAVGQGGLGGVAIGSADEAAADMTRGRVALMTPTNGVQVSCAMRIADQGWMVRLDRFWKQYGATGRAADERDESCKTDIPAVAVCSAVELGARASRAVPFVLAWRFPHRAGWYGKSGRVATPGGTFDPKEEVGNYYATKFASAEAAAAHLWDRLDELESNTVRFVRGVAETHAPDAVKEAALFNLTALRTETSFRTADGHFFGWEGCRDDLGSCYGSCTHVWGYEHALVDLWPDLARDMLETQFGPALDERGHMSFRVGLPLATSARATIAAADGQMQCIVKACEYWKRSGDGAWLKKLYPRIRKALEFCWVAGGWDADKDGVMEGSQHNTMDVNYYGPNPQMEFLYLAALKAMAAMADATGDTDFGGVCRKLAAKGGDWTEANLFNGEWYEHKVMPAEKVADGLGGAAVADPDFQLAAGCLVDQLVGDYAARHVGLGGVANDAHANKTLDTILAKCASSNVGPRYNCGRDYAFSEEPALKMAWYPEGRMPKKPFPYYGENMTGFEYVVAANLAQRGRFAEAAKVVRDIRSRYDGKKRNPFDEAECGHHYARAMAAWSVLKAWK